MCRKCANESVIVASTTSCSKSTTCCLIIIYRPNKESKNTRKYTPSPHKKKIRNAITSKTEKVNLRSPTLCIYIYISSCVFSGTEKADNNLITFPFIAADLFTMSDCSGFNYRFCQSEKPPYLRRHHHHRRPSSLSIHRAYYTT